MLSTKYRKNIFIYVLSNVAFFKTLCFSHLYLLHILRDVKCSLYIFFYFLDTCPSNFVFKLVFDVSCTTISRLRFHPLYGEPSERQLPSLIQNLFYVFFFNTQAIVPHVKSTRKISYLYLAYRLLYQNF